MEFIRPCSVFIEVLLYAEANVYSLLDTFVTILYFFSSNHHTPPIPFLSIYQQGAPTAHACPGRAAWPGCCPLQGELLYSWAQLAFLVATDFSLWVPVTPRVCLHSGVPSRLLLLGASHPFS